MPANPLQQLRTLSLTRGSTARPPLMPRPWWRRRWYVVSPAVVVVLAGAVFAILSQLLQSPCKNGLTPIGSTSVCVGLDLDSAPFKPGDPLAGLEQVIKSQNDAVVGDNFVTIVVLDNMTPDQSSDSVSAPTIRHAVEGAIVGQWRANYGGAAAGTSAGDAPQSKPAIKLLLANYGSGGKSELQAVQAIEGAQASQHIVAVTDFGQSLDTIRQAARDLSDHHIADVGALVTGDNVNQWPDGNYIQGFYRVAPDNADQTSAAMSYLKNVGGQRAMLVEDTNTGDSYAATLAKDFRKQFEITYPGQDPFTTDYKSPDLPLNDIKRSTQMQSDFGGRILQQICNEKPPVIFFAGRGVDLTAFLNALSPASGDCNLPSTPLTIMTGDDAAGILGKALPAFGRLQVNVVYTGVATGSEWNQQPPVPRQPTGPDGANYPVNFDNFAKAFAGQAQAQEHISPRLIESNSNLAADLADGYAMANQDAVLVAATAARDDPGAVANPGSVVDQLTGINCQEPILGASGEIAFSPLNVGNPLNRGNPVDKSIPIVAIQPDGSPRVQEFDWPVPGNQPFSKDAPGCH